MVPSFIEERAKAIREASDAYYNGNPIMSDTEFDNLVEAMRFDNPSHPVLGGVGAKVKLGKVKHKYRMGSLAKVKTEEDAVKWFSKYEAEEIVEMPKYDGTSLNLTYHFGNLILASTRGDGLEGMIVTNNAKELNIPLHVEMWERTDNVYVNGEVMIRKADFENLVKNGAVLSNARNAASGTIGCDDSSLVKERKLRFVAYGLQHPNVKTMGDVFTMLGGVGFETATHRFISVSEIPSRIVGWSLAGVRAIYEYQIDGLVFSVSDLSVVEDAGWSPDNHHPMAKVAWKFPNAGTRTKVIGTDFSVGRAGAITPVVLIEPTEIDGSVIERVSAGGMALFVQKGVGIGAEITICKSGDVIPFIQSVEVMGEIPDYVLNRDMSCPVCGTKIIFESRTAYCPSQSCPAKLEGRILKWLEEMGILGIGQETVHDMAEKGLVRKLFDIYLLNIDQWRSLCGSDETAMKLMKAVMEKDEMSLEKLIVGIGPEGIGPAGASVIASSHKTLKTLIDSVNLTHSGTIKYCFSGMTVAASGRAVEAIHDRIIDFMDAEKIITITEKQLFSDKLVGIKFCLTGAMSKPREEIAKMIEDCGGKVSSTCNKATNFLVQSDPESATSKSVAAKKYGVKIISEMALYDMIG